MYKIADDPRGTALFSFNAVSGPRAAQVRHADFSLMWIISGLPTTRELARLLYTGASISAYTEAGAQEAITSSAVDAYAKESYLCFILPVTALRSALQESIQ